MGRTFWHPGVKGDLHLSIIAHRVYTRDELFGESGAPALHQQEKRSGGACTMSEITYGVYTWDVISGGARLSTSARTVPMLGNGATPSPEWPVPWRSAPLAPLLHLSSS